MSCRKPFHAVDVTVTTYPNPVDDRVSCTEFPAPDPLVTELIPKTTFL